MVYSWRELAFKDYKNVMKELNSSQQGLAPSEAKKRLGKYGYNQLHQEKKVRPLRIFLNQFNNFIIYVLLFAIAVSLFIGEFTDSIVIFVILLANALLGFIQNYKAEKAILALKKMTALHSTVLRSGTQIRIPAKEVVPGDILVISEGDRIPADARIISSNELMCDESVITGESIPVMKDEKVLPAKLKKKGIALGDVKNCLFSGSTIIKGNGLALVFATGKEAEFGKIAESISNVKEELTPLQKKLDTFGKKLSFLVIGVCAFIFLLTLFRNLDALNMGSALDSFKLSISLAVAAVPEGLPVVITLALAMGVRSLSKKKALVRVLPSVETLGSTSVICTDKTGTLTKNQMTVKKLFLGGQELEVGGVGYEPKGKVKFVNSNKGLSSFLKRNALFFDVCHFCNSSSLFRQDKRWFVSGDPTEASLLVLNKKISYKPNKRMRKVKEFPFSSSRKMMSVIVKKGKDYYLLAKGAPDLMLSKSAYIFDGQRQKKLSHSKDAKKEAYSEQNLKDIIDDFASQGYRVLGFAYRRLSSKEVKQISKLHSEDVEMGFTFLGFAGMIDPIREEVPQAIEDCRNAGMRVMMITGDYPLTAKAIGKDIGLGQQVVEGAYLERVSNKKFQEIVSNVNIFARISPKQKMRIIQQLKDDGEVVAMAGDGVNDAPALKRADIGIAMGETGTEVAKQSADMILVDNSFVNISNAVFEGRRIFDNIEKFINYLLTTNLAEILVILIAVLFAFPYPLIPIQLLWINLMTDGLPAIALGMDPASKDIMKKKPYRQKKIFSKAMFLNLLFIGMLVSAGVLFVYFSKISEVSLETARTMALTTLVLLELVRLQAVRRRFGQGFFSNRALLLSLAAAFGSHLLILYTPLARFFHTVPLSLANWSSILLVVVPIIIGFMVFHFLSNRILKAKETAGTADDN